MLAGRTAPSLAEVEFMERLRRKGVTVETRSVDVAERAAVFALVEEIRRSQKPLRGVFHAAGVLDDAFVENQTWERLWAVMAPKVAGATNLHEATRDLPLDYFVLYSSASAVLGSPGQTGYAAGNAFLDGLAQSRRQSGLPALSVSWGAWASSGMAAGVTERQLARWRGLGVEPIEPVNAFGALETALRASQAWLVAVRVDWDTYCKHRISLPGAALFDELLQPGVRRDEPASGEQRPRSSSQVTDYLVRTLASVLSFPASELDPDIPLNELGIDSLTALEFKNRITSDLGVTLPTVRFLSGPSVGQLVAEILPCLAMAEPVPEVAESDPTAASQPFPLSVGQKALWLAQQLAPDNCAYNLAFAARLSPPLQLEAFQGALDQLVVRQPMLRSVVSSAELLQRILPPAPMPVQIVDISGCTDAEAHSLICRNHRQPFDLQRSLFRATVFRRQEQDILLLNVHHLVFDARSLQVVFAELRQMYEAGLHGAKSKLAPLAAQYKDYVDWQAAIIESPRGTALWEYWSRTLSGDLPILEIPVEGGLGPAESIEGAAAPFSISADVSASLRELARRNQTTLFTVLLAAMQVLLSRFSGQADVLIATPVSLRYRPEWSQVTGFFVNMLPLRGMTNPDEQFSRHLAHARETVLGALAHQEFPFPLMVERLRIRRRPDRTPVFQAVLNVFASPSTSDLAQLFHADQEATLRFGDSHLIPYAIPQQEGQFEVAVEVLDTGANLHCNLKYQTRFLNSARARDMIETYLGILACIGADPDVPIRALPRSERETFEI